jgi:hypothetical protein
LLDSRRDDRSLSTFSYRIYRPVRIFSLVLHAFCARICTATHSAR